MEQHPTVSSNSKDNTGGPSNASKATEKPQWKLASQKEDSESAAVDSLAELAKQNVAPFLAKYQPRQYAPLRSEDGEPTVPRLANAGYCYRHQPDSKCRRQADEQSMHQLQRELESLPQSDQQGIAHVWSLFSAAPAKQRKLMLQGILAQCCFPQLSFISASVRELIRIDFLTALPPELSFKILRYLDTASLCRAAQVSHRWRALADDDVVWHRMCEQHIRRKCNKCGWGLPLLDRKRLRESKREIELRATNWGNQSSNSAGDGAPNGTCSIVELPTTGKRKVDSDEQSCAMIKRHCKSPAYKPEPDDDYFKTRYRPWKDVYRDRFVVGMNWKHRRCSVKVFRGHTDSVMCLQFEDNILMTGSYDATIRIWDMETGEELRALRGHTAGIRCLQFDDTKLITGSLDRSIRVWNWRTGECISRYNGHSEAVIALHFDATLLASASVDRTVKIWNFKDKSTFVLPHPKGVNAVKIDTASRTVLTACEDGAARLWDLDTKTCIRVFHNHIGGVQQVIPLPREIELETHFAECENDHVSTSSQNGDAVNILSPVLESRALSTHHQPSSFGSSFDQDQERLEPPRYIITSGVDATIRLWETNTGRCLRTFFGHLEGIWALSADTLRIASGGIDRMVKIWDPRIPTCQDTYDGHSAAVNCIGLSDSRFITGGDDYLVRMYDFRA
ncbi:E3 ubiquitin ligase complex SCF subunit sconB [Penicillium macrosclerotiorum]|uniref:E3 ubiquitin ligase complex SCF subunit sconB n=1 Tax=Penicillium macrosclerotiorum TaxID=303699 RepID=UPI002548FFCC|nr:E3 ubiquitin ligase complex SCF subunit sconB [Penicillium macrosclerotiorum]KAJ5683622.1 E3 ubiquitin ligase complex SCF subunit sconB [Penicillium macrosclerotiorum]